MENIRDQNPPIRVSTGWGFYNKFSFLEHQTLANVTDGVELSLTETGRFDFYLDNNLKAPAMTVHLSSPIPPEHQDKIEQIDSKYDVEGYVLHPRRNPEVVKQSIRENNLTGKAMIENLDAETATSASEEQLIQCLEYLDEHRLTIDIQHLAEQYTESEAKKFIDIQAPNISQFHVSGRTGDEKHVLVSKKPKNSDLIESILQYISKNDELQSVPLVIEGKYRSISEVRKEYNYLKSLFPA